MTRSIKIHCCPVKLIVKPFKRCNLENISVTPSGFRYWMSLAGVPCFALHRLPMFFHTFSIFSGHK